MGRQSIWEYFRSVYARYRQAARAMKRKILDEFCANTKYNRKYALRLLNGPSPGRARPHPEHPGRRRPTYGKELVSVLKAIWKAAGYPWSVRLKALIPLWMPWVRKHFHLRAEVERQLLAISARQIDRRLRPYKASAPRRLYGGTRPGRLLKHHIPLRVDRWDARAPGFTEVDLVAHSGNSGEGEFAYTLNVTDVYSGWTESRAVLGRGQRGVVGALVRPTPDPVHAGTTLQEGRQRPHRAEELDARAQADGVGALRHGPGGGGHERFVSPRAAPGDERVSALGQADTQGAGGGAPASGL